LPSHQSETVCTAYSSIYVNKMDSKVLQGTLRTIVLGLCAASVLLAASPELDQARKLYNRTDFEESLKVLQAIPEKDAAVWELIGLDHYMRTEYKKAAEAFEKAFTAEPGNSDYALWLARAYGRRAETSNPITAPMQASKAHQYFEKAVQLKPDNLEALNDLFEYYLEAPGFLGGGVDKARAIAEKIAAINPGDGHWAQAKLAEQRHEYTSAEEQLKRAMEVAPHQIGKLIELARLQAKHGQYKESDQNLARAESIAPNAPKLLFVKADIYIQTGRNLDVARNLLKQYMTCTLTPDDPPRSEAERLLQKVRGT
jgi:tetratricopeptide (TPR) repeat protein